MSARPSRRSSAKHGKQPSNVLSSSARLATGMLHEIERSAESDEGPWKSSDFQLRLLFLLGGTKIVRYDHTCTATPILVHPSRVLEPAATGHANMRILTEEGLASFKAAIKAFCTAAAGSLDNLNAARVQQLLEHHKLTSDRLLAAYTVTAIRK